MVPQIICLHQPLHNRDEYARKRSTICSILILQSNHAPPHDFRDGRQLDVIFCGVLEAKTALVCHHGLEANFAIQWLSSID